MATVRGIECSINHCRLRQITVAFGQALNDLRACAGLFSAPLSLCA